MAEDFPHVTATVQSLITAGAMRPFIVVGIENPERRRDMTGPTEVAEDRKIAPRVGGSAAFRTFIRDELMPMDIVLGTSTAETLSTRLPYRLTTLEGDFGCATSCSL
jgi:hypothetical protein